MAVDFGLFRAVQAVAVYLALTWVGIFCFGFAVMTALLDWGGLAADRTSRLFRVVLVVLAVVGVAAAVVGIGGLLFG